MRRQTLIGGLAASAVGALALTGLTALPAAAAPPEVTFLSQFNAGHLASTRVDRNFGPADITAVTLTAHVPDTTATVVFQYNADPAAGEASGGWTTIASTPERTGGLVSIQWDADGAGIAPGTVAIRAAATVAGETAYSGRQQVVLSDGSSTTDSVKLTSGSVGFFTQPYADSGRTASRAVVSGTTSATGGEVALSWWDPAQQAFRGQTAATVETTSLKVSPGSPGTYVDGGTFSGVLDITAFDADDGDTIALAAERDSDDVQPVSLVRQTPTTVAATLPPGAPHRSATVTVSVTDSDDLAIVGAEVRRVSDGSLVGYTGLAGTVDVGQAAGTTDRYYANVSDVDAFEDGTDPVTSDVSAPAFVAEPTDVVPVLADGTAFDRDEYAAGDVALQVVDQDGEPFAGELPLQYALYPTGTAAPAMTEDTTDASGRLALPVDPTWAAGSYTLDYATPDGTASTAFTIGDATLGLTPAAGTAASGGQVVFTGTLALGGAPLAGRTVQLAYVRGTEAAPGTGADAGLSGSSDPLAGTVVTRADGTFSVTVADPAEAGGPAETGGRLTAAAVGTSASAGADFTAVPATTPTTPTTPGSGGSPAATAVKLKLTGSSKKGKPDHLHVTAGKAAAGEKVTVYRLTGRGKKATWKPVATRTLGAKGTLDVTVPDRNGRKRTSYRAELKGSTTVLAATSPVCRVS